MRVLLTGAAGFLGSYVLQRLIDSGHEIAVLIRPDSDCWRISTPLDQVTRITADFSAIEGARRAIAMLVAGCPCALVLATPTAMVAALPIIIGLQMLIAFLDFDTRNQPKKPLHPKL
ncbi:MAG: NAD-dependent epimerase/dehydratase family protein [Proteobacteria bacterium]|nr:NAD-dependent epimerase/dehydratase family protein [Pseudomonadota bacterium]